MVEPASTPNSGCKPNRLATPMPIRFCTMAKALARARNRATWLPLIRSSDRLALVPMVVKKAIISGACRLVSSLNGVTSWLWANSTSSATTKPPTTGAGML